MSRGGRGGRGGGGRGGGRGGGFSVTHDLIRDNLEDLGIDNFTHVEDRTPPPLYPAVEIPIPSVPTPDEEYMVRKMREITSKFEVSPYHLSRRKNDQDDIERYSDLRKKNTPTITALDCILMSACPNAGNRDQASMFIPYELLDAKAAHSLKQKARARGGDVKFDQMEKQEQSGGPKKLEGYEEDDLVDTDPEEEEEMIDDYVVDHYDSNDEDGGGSDGGGGDAEY